MPGQAGHDGRDTAVTAAESGAEIGFSDAGEERLDLRRKPVPPAARKGKKRRSIGMRGLSEAVGLAEAKRPSSAA